MKLTQLSPNLYELRARDMVYFSYETPIAFYEPIENTTFISENIWTRTTGKHINFIKAYVGGSYKQVPHEDFMFRLLDSTS